MREMIMLVYLKRERKKVRNKMEKEEERICLKKKKDSQQVVRLLLDEGKDNIAASTSAKTITL